MGSGHLAELQAVVAAAIRRALPLGADAGVDKSQVNALVTPGPRGMSSIDRLDVYREQFWLRHQALLAEDFPTVSWLLGGRPAIDALVAAYLAAVPPNTWDLQRLGEGLPAFVAGAAPWRDDPLLIDTVRLEWAYVYAFDARDAAPLDVRVLAAVPADALPSAVISFHPALSVLALGHPVHGLRRKVACGAPCQRPPPEPVCVAVWRDVAHHLLEAEMEPAEFALWSLLRDRCRLGDACEHVAVKGRVDTAALEATVARWFQAWTERGWIQAVEFPR